jgi:hypothetical protein
MQHCVFDLISSPHSPNRLRASPDNEDYRYTAYFISDSEPLQPNLLFAAEGAILYVHSHKLSDLTLRPAAPAVPSRSTVVLPKEPRSHKFYLSLQSIVIDPCTSLMLSTPSHARIVLNTRPQHLILKSCTTRPQQHAASTESLLAHTCRRLLPCLLTPIVPRITAPHHPRIPVI